ncbi:MAG: hypothetical protein MJY88_06330 [Bacteroidales bacterium]|nr:hypothetical protein [Bacteroidales bacterium]
MKKFTLLALTVAGFLFTGCYAARIVTTSPGYSVGYSTTVTYPTTNVATNIYANDYDLCLHLDLQAVGAAFAQSANVRDFEILLNNSSYMISNLDLNRDGYVDYLRVVEAVDRFTHIFVIQAVLGRDIYQDVCTLVVENPSRANCYVEIIGAPFIYGQKYIVRPIYKTRPYIFTHLCSRNYRVWTSPWHWDYYPTHYKHHAPHYLTHYQAYVTTFMHNHHYCHEVLYPTYYHYTSWDVMTRSMQRNDYGKQHPEMAFTNRTQNIGGDHSAVRRATNASDIRAAQQASTKVTTTEEGANRTGVQRATSTNTGSSASSSSASRSTATTSANRSTGSATSSSASRSTATTSNSSANRSTATTSSSSSANRSTAGTTSGSTANRSTTTSSSSSASRSTSSSSSSSASRSTSGTTVNSRVNNNGAARTTTSSGSSVSRSTSSSSAPARSTTSSSASRSTSGSTATRSSSSSTSSSSSASRSTGSSSSTTGPVRRTR